jgi:uncharacterized SAM-binding protein YcdF (DUF218 family)
MYEFVVHLLEPLTFLALSLIAATTWLWRRQRPRTRPLVATTVVVGFLVIVSLPLTGYLALSSLEAAYPPTIDVPESGATLVVLSAGLVLDDAAGQQVRLDHESTARCLHAVRLYKRAGRCRVVLSGGKLDLAGPEPAIAEAMRDFVVELGVRPEDTLLEDKSRTTYENALYSKALLQDEADRRIWLVTSASHMNRAERCFRKQGFVVTPAPCAHQVAVWEFDLTDLIPSLGGLAQFTCAAHEWQGRIWYRLRGRI